MKKKHEIAIILGITCILLTFSIMVQLRTTNNLISIAGNTYRENDLRDEVLRWKEKYDVIYEQLQLSEKQLEEERKVSTSSDDSSLEKQEELKRINTYLGLTDVQGEGMIITLYDNTPSTFSTSNDLIHDDDLRRIVNELKNNGVEAISINGERIVPSTTITCAGTVILVNGEIIGSPFVIKAIGDQSRINNIMRPGGYIYMLQEQYGFNNIEAKKSDHLVIEKFNGALTNRYIKNVK